MAIPQEVLVGIDLGTTYTKLSNIVNDQPYNLKGPCGEMFSSVVAVKKKQKKDKQGMFNLEANCLVGQPAETKGNTHIVVRDAKRVIGLSITDKQVNYLKTLNQVQQFSIVDDDQSKKALIRVAITNEENPKDIDFVTIPPQWVSKMILQNLRKTLLQAMPQLKDQKIPAVVTVPSNFDASQRQATLEAIEQSGFQAQRLIAEPTAAAIHYFSSKAIKTTEGELYMVFDFGGGTLDISVLEVGANDAISALFVDGDNFLGGRDFDALLLQDSMEYLRERGFDLRETVGAPATRATQRQKLEQIVQKVKEFLSVADTAEIDYSCMDDDSLTSRTITRSEFEDLVRQSDIPRKTLNLLETVTETLKTHPRVQGRKISAILLAGGTSNVPIVRDWIKMIFPNTEIVGCGDTGFAVVKGAATITKSQYSEKVSDILPLSLGVELNSGAFSRILNQFEVLPVERISDYSTTEKSPTSGRVNVYQGEDSTANRNALLGSLDIQNVSNRKIKVKFRFDLSGTLRFLTLIRKQSQEISRITK